MDKSVQEKLAAPFPLEEVEVKVQSLSRDKKRAQVVAYVDARTILDRLDSVVGPEGWSDSYEVLSDAQVRNGDTTARLVEVKCRLTILGTTKEDVGEGDTLKAAFSDALKRAAVKFGIGRYLYRLPKVWVDVDEYGRFDVNAAKAAMFGGGEKGEEKVEPKTEAKGNGGGATSKQIFLIKRLAKEVGAESEGDVLDLASAALGREVSDLQALSVGDASKVIDHLNELKKMF